MKIRNLILSLVLVTALVLGVVGTSLMLQPQSPTLGMMIIIGAAILGVLGSLSGINDTFDLVGKLFGGESLDERRKISMRETPSAIAGTAFTSTEPLSWQPCSSNLFLSVDFKHFAPKMQRTMQIIHPKLF